MLYDIAGSDDAYRSYLYFDLQTASPILGSQDSSYRTPSLAQLSYLQPAVKHALTAMASPHMALQARAWYLNAKGNDHGRALLLLSWNQSNQAIQRVLQDASASRIPLELLILLCLVFDEYHNFQREYSAAYLHIRRGLRTVEQWSQDNHNATKSTFGSTMHTTKMIRDHVAPILLLLDQLVYSITQDHVN